MQAESSCEKREKRRKKYLYDNRDLIGIDSWTNEFIRRHLLSQTCNSINDGRIMVKGNIIILDIISNSIPIFEVQHVLLMVIKWNNIK